LFLDERLRVIQVYAQQQVSYPPSMYLKVTRKWLKRQPDTFFEKYRQLCYKNTIQEIDMNRC
jgi:hypothetical protein